MEQLPPLLRRRALSQTLCANCLRKIRARPSRAPFQRLRPSYRHYSSSAASTSPSESDDVQTFQAHPLTGYYSDLLSIPTPVASSTRSQMIPSARPKKPQSEMTPQERARIVFGSRLAGPGGKSSRYNPSTVPESNWQTINGVRVPPRPSEPDNCCMSGCAHCVWDDYRDDVEAWADGLRKASARGMSQAMSSRSNISMDDDGGGSETNWGPGMGGPEELFGGIPVGIREFMRTEKRLRDKERKRASNMKD